MHFTPSMPQWGPAPLEHFPVQMPVDIQIDTQIQQALIERSAAYCLTSGQVIAQRTQELPLVEQLWHAKQLASRLCRSKALQFFVTRKADGAHLQPKELGEQVLHLLSSCVGTIWQQYPCHALEPRIELLLECAAKRNLLFLNPACFHLGQAHLLQLVDSLNGFVQDVRKRGTSAGFKSKAIKFETQIDKRYKAMQNYFRQLCALYPHGHVIRLDFSYQPHGFVGYQFTEEMHKTVTLHGQALLDHLTQSLGTAVVGYSWKRDFATARGFQYHLVAILNGPQIHELHGIEQSLGEYWCHSITGGEGLWFNCHGSGGTDYHYRGMGSLWHRPRTMEEHLSLVPVFMTLTDGIAAFAPPGKAKPYGMATLPAGLQEKTALKMSQYSTIKNDVFSLFQNIEL